MKSIKDSAHGSQSSPFLPGSILIRRQDNKLPYARVTATGDDILIEYGYRVCDQVIAAESEYLSLAVYPELSTLFDGRAWDIDILHALISPAGGDLELAS